MDPIPPAPSAQPVVLPPVSTVIPTSKPGNHIFIWIIGGVIVLGIGIIGGLFLGKQLYPAPQIPPTPAPISQPTSTPDPTANWKTYVNESLEITFKHPIELKENTISSSDINGVSLENSNYRIVVLSGINKGLSREEQEKFINDIAAEGKKITVDGQSGSLSSLSYQGLKTTTAYVVSKRGGSLFSISIQTKTLSAPTDIENIFDQILSTFRFVGQGSDSEGKFCGGIAGVICSDGYKCKYDGTYPDASGVCIKN